MTTARLVGARFRPRLLHYRGSRSYIADSTLFREGDTAILRPIADPTHKGKLTTDLQPLSEIATPSGILKGTDIIGKRVRDVVITPKGVKYRIQEPSLAEYVILTRRIVTPIYPVHANLIVNYLDLHPTPSEDSYNKLEILEVGTGHGSLTLHIARAIHAANSHLASFESLAVPDSNAREDSTAFSEHKNVDDWKSKRSAVLHTLDVSARHSAHAESIVKNYRRGLYYGNVDFHVGGVPQFFAARYARETRQESKQFLSHAVIDVPSADQYLNEIADHLWVDGKLLVFNPSVTQIAECMERIHLDRLPLHLEGVVELAGGFAGGREWDVRLAKIRNPIAAASDSSPSGSSSGSSSEQALVPPLPEELSQSVELPKPHRAVVCRPMAGDRVVVGGFLGIWRRQRHDKICVEPSHNTKSVLD